MVEMHLEGRSSNHIIYTSPKPNSPSFLVTLMWYTKDKIPGNLIIWIIYSIISVSHHKTGLLQIDSLFNSITLVFLYLFYYISLYVVVPVCLDI